MIFNNRPKDALQLICILYGKVGFARIMYEYVTESNTLKRQGLSTQNFVNLRVPGRKSTEKVGVRENHSVYNIPYIETSI